MEKLINGRYEIQRLIGSGGMADVYVAYDNILDRLIALKIIRVDLINDPISLLRFQREAKAISKMDHQNIVQVYDIGEHCGRPYIVMEYVQGKTLKQLLQKRIALPVHEAIDIMKQLINALIHAHNNNIIHRDIKPHNVLIKDDGTAKITDFGIALSHDNLQITAHDIVLGSAHYLAPEIANGEDASNLSDIYALGIVFFELLTGSVPFNANTPVQIAMAHINDELPKINSINQEVSNQLEMIIQKACCKDVSHRYQSAEEFLYDLEHVDELPTNNQSIKVDKQPKKLTLKQYYLILASSCSLILIITYFVLSVIFRTSTPIDKITVPNVLGKSRQDAISTLQNIGFNVEVNSELVQSENYMGGSVAETSLSPDTIVDKGSKIVLSISKSRVFTMPNFIGLPVNRVYQRLIENNINVKVKEKLVASDRSVGTVINQNINEGNVIEINENTVIEVEVAVDYKKVIVPKVIGMTISEANQILTNAKLKVEINGSGKVTSQSVDAFEIVNEQSNITIKGDS